MLTLAGRLADYRYYDMDDAIRHALELYQAELAPAEDTMY